MIQAEEPTYTSEDTEITVKIIYINNAKAGLEQFIGNEVHLNDHERTKLLILLKEFEYWFDETLVE